MRRGRAFLTAYVGGYAIWLAYGLMIGDFPVILVHAVGLVCGTVTLAVALALRGSLRRPRTWDSCRVELSGAGSGSATGRTEVWGDGSWTSRPFGLPDG